MKWFVFTVAAVSIVFFHAAAAADTEIVIHSSAIQKILMKEVFTQGGRKYILGDPSSPCMYAHLSHPEVVIAAGKIHLKSYFKGMIGYDTGEQCIGLNDAFYVTMSGVPYYKDGIIGLSQIETGDLSGNAQFDKYLAPFIKQELPGTLQHNLTQEIRSLLQRNHAALPCQVEMTTLDIPQIQAENNTLNLKLTTHIILK
jgi:hypothetical protein